MTFSLFRRVFPSSRSAPGSLLIRMRRQYPNGFSWRNKTYRCQTTLRHRPSTRRWPESRTVRHVICYLFDPDLELYHWASCFVEMVDLCNYEIYNCISCYFLRSSTSSKCKLFIKTFVMVLDGGASILFKKNYQGEDFTGSTIIRGGNCFKICR